MTFKAKLFSAAFVAALSAGGAQAATTYDFDLASPETGPFSLSCGTNAPGGCVVSHDPLYGYGVKTLYEVDEDVDGTDEQILVTQRIDGRDGYWETLTVTFESAVRLIGFDLGAFNVEDEASNDDYNYRVNGGDWIYKNIVNPNLVGLDNVTSFEIGAWGKDMNDEFTLRSITVAPVPLPATGLLMLAALGGLGAMARRRKG